MADEVVSSSDYAEVYKAIKSCFAREIELGNGGVGISGPRLREFYLDQLDPVLVEEPGYLKRKRKGFPDIIGKIIDDKNLIDYNDTDHVFILIRPLIPQNANENKENESESAAHSKSEYSTRRQSIAPRNRIDDTLRAGIDPKGLAPRHKKRRITEVGESDASDNESSAASPRIAPRPALSSMDINRKISVPMHHNSPSVRSESSTINCLPGLGLGRENQYHPPNYSSDGLEALRRKYPDSNIQVTGEDSDEVLCMDCEKSYKRAGIDNHLKSNPHKMVLKALREKSLADRMPAPLISTVSTMAPPSVVQTANSGSTTGATGGFLENIVANAINQSSEVFNGHIKSLEARMQASEQSYAQMVRQRDEYQRQTQDLVSQLEQVRKANELTNERLAAAERRNEEGSMLRARVKTLEELCNTMKSAERSTSDQVDGANRKIREPEQVQEAHQKIKALEQTVLQHSDNLKAMNATTKTTRERVEYHESQIPFVVRQDAQINALGRQCHATAHEFAQKLTTHSRTQDVARQNQQSDMEKQFQMVNQRIADLLTAVAKRNSDIDELKNRSSRGNQVDREGEALAKSQAFAEIRSQHEELSTQLKTLEKKVAKQAGFFTSLDHRTAEWVSETDRNHDSKITALGKKIDALQMSLEEKFKNTSVHVGHIERANNKQAEDFRTLENSTQKQLSTFKDVVSGLEDSVNVSTAQIESSVSECNLRKEAQDAILRELNNAKAELTQNMCDLRTHYENHHKSASAAQKEDDLEMVTVLNERFQALEQDYTEMICSLRTDYEDYQKSASTAQEEQSAVVQTVIDERIVGLERRYSECADTVQHLRAQLTKYLDSELQRRLEEENARLKASTQGSIDDFISWRDKELSKKYEDKFNPMIYKFMENHVQTLEKKHDEEMHSSLQTRFLERDQQLEKKYEETFRPMIAKFMTDQLTVVNEEHETRLRELLASYGHQTPPVQVNSAVKSEEELRDVVMTLLAEKEELLRSEHQVDPNDLLELRAELTLQEEMCREAMLSLKQMLENKSQQLDDVDEALPYLNEDIRQLRRKVEKVEAEGKKATSRVWKKAKRGKCGRVEKGEKMDGQGGRLIFSRRGELR